MGELLGEGCSGDVSAAQCPEVMDLTLRAAGEIAAIEAVNSVTQAKARTDASLPGCGVCT
jgi:hypothetical protein